MKQIIKPQMGDKGLDSADRYCKYIVDKWVCMEGTSPVYPVSIFRRDGKAFIPESEE